jgi:hypothetical protein
MPKPAAWAITQNRDLWPHFDPINDDAVVIDWSLADNYRVTDQMAPGDRTVFWVTGDDGGVARVGFLLEVVRTDGEAWIDARGHRHDSPYGGVFYLPPFPRRSYIHRSALELDPAFQDCELVTPGVRSSQPPLRIEQPEWNVIERLVRELSELLLEPIALTE